MAEIEIEIEQLKRPRIRPYAFNICVSGTQWDNVALDRNILLVIEWLIFNIGDVDSDTWKLRNFKPLELTVYLSTEEDAAAFKLRWG